MAALRHSRPDLKNSIYLNTIKKFSRTNLVQKLTVMVTCIMDFLKADLEITNTLTDINRLTNNTPHMLV